MACKKTGILSHLTSELFSSFGHMHGIPAGNYVRWGRWSVCIRTRTMGTSTLQYQQHTADSCTVGTGLLSDTSPEHVWGMTTGGMCREQISRSLPPPRPPFGFTARSVPCGGLRGNGFDLLHPEPLRLGVKQNIGQWDRMFLDNFSSERGSLGPRRSAGLCGRCGRSGSSLSRLQDS